MTLVSLLTVVVSAGPVVRAPKAGERFILDLQDLPDSYWVSGGCLPYVEFKPASTLFVTDCVGTLEVHYSFVKATENFAIFKFRDLDGTLRDFAWWSTSQGGPRISFSNRRFSTGKLKRAPARAPDARQPYAESPQELVNQRFYESGAGLRLRENPRWLSEANWKDIVFGDAGTVLVDDIFHEAAPGDGRTFSVRAIDGGFLLDSRGDKSGYRWTYFWSWIDRDRAVTTLYADEFYVFSRASPSPMAQRERFGEEIARKTLPPGGYTTRDGGAVFTLASDGGFSWRGDGGHFFACTIQCCDGASWGSCLEWRGQLYSFVIDDGVMSGVPVTWSEANGCEVPSGPAALSGPAADAGMAVKIEWNDPDRERCGAL